MKKRIFGILAALLLMVQVMPVMAAEGDNLSLDNKAFTFTDIDGGEVTTQSSGRPKLFVFFNPGCWNFRNTLKSIASSDWLANGEVEVCAIEITQQTADEVRKFQNDYCSGSAIRFVADETRYAWNRALEYDHLLNPTSTGMTTPLIVMIDKDNKIQYMTQGQYLADEIATNYLH